VSTAAVPFPRPLVLADVVPRTRARDAALIVGAALLTALLAQVAIPVAGSPVPITGQTLAVVLTAAALGPLRGVSGQALYIVLGSCGLPFFSDASSGIDVVLGATGGYLVAFLPAAYVIGAAAAHGADRHVLRAAVLFATGQLVIFAVGVPWLAVVADLSPQQALDAGFYPFLVGGFVKAVVAGVLTPAAWRLVPPDVRAPRA
jgi:biotin transport system substrate-specific component